MSGFRRQTRAGPRLSVSRQARQVTGTSASSDTECHLLVPVRFSRPVLHSLSRRPHSRGHCSGRETRKRHIPPPPEAIIFRFTRPGRPPPWGEVSANSMCFSCQPAHQRRPQCQWHRSPAHAYGRHTANTRIEPRCHTKPGERAPRTLRLPQHQRLGAECRHCDHTWQNCRLTRTEPESRSALFPPPPAPPCCHNPPAAAARVPPQ